MSRRRSLAVLAAAAIAIAGCGTTNSDSGDTIAPAEPIPTLGGVGSVPVVPSAIREPVVVVRPPVNVDGTDADLIGEIVDGNRVLMIGDSILASTSSRYGDHMCDAVVPLGWEVAVEAEPSRFVDFGNRVLDRMLDDDPADDDSPDDDSPDDDWDAAVVFLGSNYGSDAFRYEAELIEILDRLSPRPILLLTVTEYRPNYVEVNTVVNRLGAQRDNVTVVDWKTISETPGILSGDRLHPTDAGRRALAESIAVALGTFPGGYGDCLPSTFRDDSAVRGNSSTVLGRPTTGSGSGGSATTTTVRSSATTTTTVRPSSAATTTTTSVAGGGGTPGTTTTTPTTSSSIPASTAAPATTAAPVTTAAPTTAPSITAPPAQPPSVSAP